MNTHQEQSPDVRPPGAAICTESDSEADVVLDAVIRCLEDEGFRVASPRASDIFQMTDDTTIDHIGKALAAQLDRDVDLVVFTRFGDRESSGQGFCPVIHRATELRIPVLTIVTAECQQRWHDFDTGALTTLPGDQAAVLDWCHTNVYRRTEKD